MASSPNHQPVLRILLLSLAWPFYGVRLFEEKEFLEIKVISILVDTTVFFC